VQAPSLASPQQIHPTLAPLAEHYKTHFCPSGGICVIKKEVIEESRPIQFVEGEKFDISKMAQ